MYRRETGFTQAALNTLVTFAERDGRRLVCVSLRTNGPQIYADTAACWITASRISRM